MRLLKVIMTGVIWAAAVGLVVVFFVLIVGKRGAPVVAYIAPLGVLLLAPLTSHIVTSVRRRRGAAVLTYVEQAVRLNLPLTRMLDAAQRSEESPLALRLRDLSRRLASGQALGASLAAVPEISPAAVSAITAAEEIGRLPHALRRLTRRQTARVDADAADGTFIRAYPFLLVLMITAAVAIFCIFVLPKYETIFHDFGIKLPAITQFVIDAARALQPLAVILAALMFLGWLIALLWRMFDPHMIRWEAPLRLRDHILWSLPLAHGLQRDRGLGDALDLVHDAIRAGHPMDRAVEQASNIRVNFVLRQQLQDWAAQIVAGVPLHEAARLAQLPPLIGDMLAPVRGSAQAAEVLEFLTRYYDSRFSRTRVLIQAAAVPAMVLFFAAIIACISLGMMMPLVSLVQNVAMSIFPSWP